MKDDYTLTATILHRREKTLLDDFEAEFGSRPGVECQRRSLVSELHMEYDPMVLARAEVWAELHEDELHVEEFLTRSHSLEECLAAPSCRLSFPPCELVPPEQLPGSCPSCGGHVQSPSADAPERLEFDGVGESGGSLFLPADAGKRLKEAGFAGFSLAPWPVDDQIWRLQPDTLLHELLVEGENVLGLADAACEDCGRTACRFHLGPSLLKGAPDVAELDVLGTSYLGFHGLAFSPRLARHLLKEFPAVTAWEPVWLRKS